MHQTTPLEHNCLKNMLAKHFLLLFFHTPSWKLNENEAPLNKKPMGLTTLWQSGTTMSRGLDIIMHNNHKPLLKFLNGKNTNNKVNHWPLELVTYNITFKWISCAWDKAVIARLVEVHECNAQVTGILANAITVAPAHRSATCIKSKTKASLEVPPTDASKINPSSPLKGDHRNTLLQMQWTDPFCKCISKQSINGKAPHYESDTFTNIDGLLYKHAMDASQKFLALFIPKAWHFMMLVKHMIR